MHTYDVETGKVFSGPDTDGRYNKERWEGPTEDPFGFRKKARIFKEKQDESKAKFQEWIKEHDDAEYINAAKNAADVAQRKDDEIAQHAWRGKLPPLIYRDNHWRKKP